MDFIPLSLPGLILIRPILAQDNRGFLIKNYSYDLFLKHGINFVPKEEFYSISQAGVLRGMHFQIPPGDYGKLVHCARGRVYDVALDIRAGSPTYGQAWGGELDDVRREALYLPPGFAHGFYSFAPETIVSYSVSHVHHKDLDQGIRWDSFDHAWPCPNPVISPRDGSLPTFQDSTTPFFYQ